VLFQFVLEGNLASQPRLSTSRNGHPVCVVRVLHNSRYRAANGQWTEGRTISVDLVCWRDLAERVAALNKGDTIIAEVADDLYVDTNGRYPAIQATARTIAVSMRWHGATSHRGTGGPAPDDAHHEVPATGGYDTGSGYTNADVDVAETEPAIAG
jgi:single-stranded DNA-binding protein